MFIKSSVVPVIGGAIFFLGSSVLQAQDQLVLCADITNADERLACYDRAFEASRNLPVVRLPRNGQQASKPAQLGVEVGQQGNPTDVGQDEFGLELKQKKRKDDGPRSRTYQVLSATHNDFTGWTIEFEGGGKWKQIGTDDYDINVGDSYNVRRGTFNSYMLSNAENNRKIKITRIE